MASPSAAPGAAQLWAEHLWAWGCPRRAIAHGGALQTSGALRSGARSGRPCCAITVCLAAETPWSQCCWAGADGQAASTSGRYLASSCSGCIRVFPITPKDLMCRGLNPKPWPHSTGCCTETSSPWSWFRDWPAGEILWVQWAEGSTAQCCPQMQWWVFCGEGRQLGMELQQALPCLGQPGGKRGLESLIWEHPLAEGRWKSPRSTLSVPLQKGWVFNWFLFHCPLSFICHKKQIPFSKPTLLLSGTVMLTLPVLTSGRVMTHSFSPALALNHPTPLRWFPSAHAYLPGHSHQAG